jgi:hypothetical protein
MSPKQRLLSAAAPVAALNTATDECTMFCSELLACGTKKMPLYKLRQVEITSSSVDTCVVFTSPLFVLDDRATSASPVLAQEHLSEMAKLHVTAEVDIKCASLTRSRLSSVQPGPRLLYSAPSVLCGRWVFVPTVAGLDWTGPVKRGWCTRMCDVGVRTQSAGGHKL